jgi:hypothetical protein
MSPYGAPPPVPAGFGNIFRKWINVTTKPGVESFAIELPTANWGDIWVSIFLLAILSAVLVFFVIQVAFQFVISAMSSSSSIPPDQIAGFRALFGGLGLGISLGEIVFIPLGFLIWMGIFYLIAKMFGGSGTFMQQCYAVSLYYVPITVVNLAVSLVPFVGSVASAGLGIYGIVLQVFAFAASHRLSTGKAVAVVLLPLAILFLLCCGLFILIIALGLGASQHLTS